MVHLDAIIQGRKRYHMKLGPLLLLLCGALNAQDLTGRWVGVADTTDEAGTKLQERQTLEIRSEDGKLTGNTIGRREARDSLSGPAGRRQSDLYGFITFEGGEHLRWKLALKDGKLVGTFSALHDSPKKWIYDRIGATTLDKAEPSK